MVEEKADIEKADVLKGMLKELEELKSSYFMLQMQDRWGDDDYKYAAMLRGKINKLELEIRNLESEG